MALFVSCRGNKRGRRGTPPDGSPWKRAGVMAAKYEGEEIALLKLAAAHGNKEAEELLHQYNGEMQG